MASAFRLLSVLTLTAAIAAGCERAPTAPQIDDVAALLSISNPSGSLDSRVFKNTLPALFRESIAQVEARQGRQGVEELLGEWRLLQEKLKTDAPSLPRAAIQARLAAIHEEELRVVERVLGERATQRIIVEAKAALSKAKGEIHTTAARGEAVQSAWSVANDAAVKLEAAERAMVASESRRALETASQAATLVAALHYHLNEIRRVHGIETLLPEAVAKLRNPNGDADPEVAKLEQLNARVREALASGNRSAANALLAEARAAQIRIVLQAFGTQAATRLISQVDDRARELESRVAAVGSSRPDSVKLERMLHEARDMNARARIALGKGNASTALDLGSHAAGLLNALQHLTWD